MKGGLGIVLVLSFVLFFSVSFVSAYMFPDFWKQITGHATTATAICGNGILETGELCDYAANDLINNPYGSQCSTSCWVNAAPPYWAGCRGSGVHVCTDNPLITNQYFIDNPFCIKATNCNGLFYNCNGVICPPPTQAEIANNQTNTTNQNGVCTDSAGTLNYYVQGTLVFNGQVIGSDFCNSAGQLNKLYCVLNNTSYTSTLYNCPNGCLNGACITSNNSSAVSLNGTGIITECSNNGTLGACPTNTTNQTTSTCTDSDGGLNYYVKGTLTYTNNPYGVLEEYDNCDLNSLIEGVCNSQTNYTQNHVRYNCPNGCLDGACIGSSLVNYTLQDGQKININVNNVIYNIYVASISPGYLNGIPTNTSPEVGFFINGSYPHPDIVGDWLSLDNGVVLKVTGINLNPNEVTFFLYENSTGLNTTNQNNNQTCQEVGGQLCSVQNICSGTVYISSDSNISSQLCCIQGNCSPPSNFNQTTGNICSLGQLEQKTCTYNGVDYTVKRITQCEIQVSYDATAEQFTVPMLSQYTLMNGVSIKNPDSCSSTNLDLTFTGGNEVNNCQGCFDNGVCYPIGYRTSNEYCTLNLSLVPQKNKDANGNWASCNNNFECASNLCIQNQCVGTSFIQNIINWVKNNLGFIKRFLGLAGNKGN